MHLAPIVEKTLLILIGIGVMMPLSLSLSARYITNVSESLLSFFILFTVLLARISARNLQISLYGMVATSLLIGLVALGSLSALVALFDYNFGEASLVHLLRWFVFALLVLTLTHYLSDPAVRSLFIKSMFLGVVFTGVLSWMVWVRDQNYLQRVPFLHIRDPELLGSPLNRNTLGLYLAMGFPLGVYVYSYSRSRIARLLVLGLIGFLLISTFLTFSRGAWIGSALLLVTFIIYYVKLDRLRKISSWFLLSIIGIISFYVSKNLKVHLETFFRWYDNIDARTRMSYLKDSIDILIQYPLIGVGPGNYHAAAVQMDLHTTRDPHNSFSWVGAEYGLIGLLIIALLILFPLFSLFYRKTVKRICFERIESFLIVSLGIYLFVRSWTTGVVVSSELLWVLIALTITMPAFCRCKCKLNCPPSELHRFKLK